jgi:hypothetical protein
MATQIILILLLALPFLLAVYFFKNKQLNKLFLLGIFLLMSIFLLFPSSSQKWLLSWGGLSRQDVLIYLSVGLFSFLFVYLYAKFKTLEQRQTLLTREISIREAKKPGE